MEYDILINDTSKFIQYNCYASVFTPLDPKHKTVCLSDTSIKSYTAHILDAKYEQANIHDVAFDQHHLLLDQSWFD